MKPFIITALLLMIMLSGCSSDQDEVLLGHAHILLFKVEQSPDFLDFPPVVTSYMGQDFNAQIDTVEAVYRRLSQIYEFGHFTFLKEFFWQDVVAAGHQDIDLGIEDFMNLNLKLKLENLTEDVGEFMFTGRFYQSQQPSAEGQYSFKIPAGQSVSIGTFLKDESEEGLILVIRLNSIRTAAFSNPEKLKQYLIDLSPFRMLFPEDREIFIRIFGESDTAVPETWFNWISKPVPIDETVQMLRQPELVYPFSAIEDEVTGTVFLHIAVEADGAVSKLEIIRGVREDLDQAALQSMKHVPFQPAKRNGSPVRCEVILPVKFQLDH